MGQDAIKPTCDISLKTWLSHKEVCIYTSLSDKTIPYKNKMSIAELGKIRTESNLKTTLNMTLVDENDFCIDTIKHHFDKDKFFIKLSPINPNATSDKNKLGKGVVDGVNLV